MVCFSHVLVPSFIEQHDLGGRKRTVTRTKPSRLEAVKIPNVFNCDGLFEKIISVRHNKKSKTPKKGINKDPLVLVFFKPKIQCVFLHQTPIHPHHLWRPKINRLPREPLQPDRVQESCRCRCFLVDPVGVCGFVVFFLATHLWAYVFR